MMMEGAPAARSALQRTWPEIMVKYKDGGGEGEGRRTGGVCEALPPGSTWWKEVDLSGGNK